MKFVVYACVFGGYDWVFPPIKEEGDLDYILITEDAEMQVNGWTTRVVDISKFRNSKTANLYYRALFHRIFTGYDYSLYVDGNIRLLGKTKDFFTQFIPSGKALGLFPHPLRSTVKEEAEVCLLAGKVTEPDRLVEELKFQKAEGFPDNVGLIETTIILKNHHHPDLDPAMSLWWSLYERFGTRDQIGLPFAIWKVSTSRFYQSFSFRDPNPYFGLYSHRGDKRAPKHYAYIEGRAYDSLLYSIVLKVWQTSWVVRRYFRKINTPYSGNY
jgi:hypothetical protein